MYTTDINHCQVVLESLAADRADEQTLASVSILSEKLQNLQKSHRCFVDVEFSPYVQAITERKMDLAIS